jgi:hypothetical protein
MNFQFKDLSFNISEDTMQAGDGIEGICTPTCTCTFSTCTSVSCTCTINPSTYGCNFSFSPSDTQAHEDDTATLLLAQLRNALAPETAPLVLN